MSVHPYRGADTRQLHVLAAGARPLRVGERHPGESAAVGAAGGHHLLRVHVEERVVRDLAREVLEVVDLVAPRVELRLARRAAGSSGLVAEPARRVVEHHVAARREPGVVVVPALAGAEVRSLPGGLVARAAAVHEHDQRISAGRRGRRGTRDVDVERRRSRPRRSPARWWRRRPSPAGPRSRRTSPAPGHRSRRRRSGCARTSACSRRCRTRTCSPARPCASGNRPSGSPGSRPARQPCMRACRPKPLLLRTNASLVPTLTHVWTARQHGGSQMRREP